MARPATVNLNSGNQGWDGRCDDNFDIVTEAPFPIYESAIITSLAALQSNFAAAAHDRCFAWINLTTYGYTLCWSNGTTWITYGMERRPMRTSAVTTAQVIADKFIRFTGAGAVDYDFLTASAWAGGTVEVRNDAALAINLDPNGTETINGSATSLALAVGSTARVYSDGSGLYASISL